MSHFPEIKKNFGFGCMRLPLLENGEVDTAVFSEMIDTFIAAGFNYFDTARMYVKEKSEPALKTCLTSRHAREEYLLADKLSNSYFEKEEDIRPLFEDQLAVCGVEYFDFYLIHCINRDTYPKYKSCNAFEIIKKLKEQGKIKHIAMSFHDTADYLDMVLSEQKDIEAVQLQLNYLDYDDPGVQSKACYDVAVKHGKKVIVMEPVKGGALVNLPEKAEKEFDKLGGGSYASYALRYAASYPEVFMVLSGMGSMAMMEDNLNTFADFVPLNEEELKTTDRVREIIREVRQVPCTKCKYCTEVCPQNIQIPDIFEIYNSVLAAKTSIRESKPLLPKENTPADCVKCGKCEKNCPQNIEIRQHLEKIAKW